MPERPCLDAALEYRARGWSVMPLCPPDHHRCSETHVHSCAAPGKRPLCNWRELQARLPRESELILWWTRWPTANVALILGSLSRLVGFDIDGPESEDLLLERFPGVAWEPTLEFKTPGGGRRILYATPPGLVVPRRRWDRGLSHVILLGEGSYSVMPPSVHPLGVPYQWTTTTSSRTPNRPPTS